MEKPDLVPIAGVVKAHGVRGAVKVQAYGDTLGGLGPGERLFLISPGGAPPAARITLRSLRPHQRGWICEFEQIENMDQAAELAGKQLALPRDRLPELPEGEYYHFQLIGLTVRNSRGETLGTLRAIIETGSNDVYVVDGPGEELLIPALEDVICGVDLEKGEITVDPPEGL